MLSHSPVQRATSPTAHVTWANRLVKYSFNVISILSEREIAHSTKGTCTAPVWLPF